MPSAGGRVSSPAIMPSGPAQPHSYIQPTPLGSPVKAQCLLSGLLHPAMGWLTHAHSTRANSTVKPRQSERPTLLRSSADEQQGQSICHLEPSQSQLPQLPTGGEGETAESIHAPDAIHRRGVDGQALQCSCPQDWIILPYPQLYCAAKMNCRAYSPKCYR